MTSAAAATDEPKKKGKKPGTGQTAMKHARAVCAADYPGLPLLEAQKSVVWIPDGRGACRSCGRNLRPISKREDLFGTFDILVPTAPLHLIQVTTETSRAQTVTARRRKIEREFIDEFGAVLLRGAGPAPTLSIWSWVPRKHFLTTDWVWGLNRWSDRTELRSPGLARGS